MGKTSVLRSADGIRGHRLRFRSLSRMRLGPRLRPLFNSEAAYSGAAMSPKLVYRRTALDSISGTISCGLALTVVLMVALHFLGLAGV